MDMKVKEKFERFIKDEDKLFKGWDFSYLSNTGRMKEFPLSWNYFNIIMDWCKNIDSLLDMGTGGGEFLGSLPFLPKDTCATEGYEPNILVAKERLEPGIKVYPVRDDNNLPFDSKRFDLIINRHESYSPSEVKRILKDGGYFITQQVGGLNDIDINMLLGAPYCEYEGWNLRTAANELIEHGLNIIDMKEDKVKTRFYDIGALIYYLKAIPWQVKDFSVDKYYDRLLYIHEFIEKQGYIDVTCHRFLVIAQKI